MEEASFDALQTEETAALVERMLHGYGFDASLAGDVQRDLAAVCATPLTTGPRAPSLAGLHRDEQLRELEFTLSADEPSLNGLAELLAAHRAPAAAPDYHERLRGLDAQSLQCFLRGYIDLVFRWEGRWYVADYKSNKLPAYDSDAVVEVMDRNHYLLQAQLYSAAAQRHLRQRIPDYDPEQHWGGALFLFVRGMRGTNDASASVFFDRQPPALLSAVDDWLGVST
jgi:exodeoxyribonuclease V beta subunit